MKEITFEEAVTWSGIFSNTLFSIRFFAKNPIVISKQDGLTNLDGIHPAVMIGDKLHLVTCIPEIDNQDLDECDVRRGGLFCEVY